MQITCQKCAFPYQQSQVLLDLGIRLSEIENVLLEIHMFCLFTEWLDNIKSKLVHYHDERNFAAQGEPASLVVPITSILGRLAFVPAGNTSTNLYSMRSASALRHSTRVPHVTQGIEQAMGALEQVIVCQHLGNDMVPETLSWKQ
jgi:hypothetical protein